MNAPIDTLPILTADQEAIAAVRALHCPFNIYGECEHDHQPGDADTVEVSEVGTTCEDGLLRTICGECCTGGSEYQTADCADNHSACWPCNTVRAITAALDGAQ